MHASEAGRHLGLDQRHFTAQSDLAMELQAFRSGLPAELGDLFDRLLADPSLTAVARNTGIARATLYDRRCELRRRMAEAGLDKYLLKANGLSQVRGRPEYRLSCAAISGSPQMKISGR